MIHKYRMFDLNIVLDINSGSVHILDDISYNLLDFDIKNLTEPSEEILNKVEGDKEEIKEAFYELKKLQENGELYSEDYLTVEDVKKFRINPPVKALCLHICHDCNLRCKYCFAETGSFHGERSMMSEEVGLAAIDFVIKNSGKRKNIEIDFFGGEPLMNFDVVKKIVDYANEQGKIHGKNFRYTLTTNGMLLDDEIIDYLNENMSNIVLSLDGTKETNDFLRPDINKQGSYDKIIDNYKKIAKLRNQDNYYVRGTFTAHNLNFTKDILHIADEGFLQTSMEPVVLSKTHPLAIKEEHLPIVKREYEILAEEYLKRIKDKKGFNFFHFMIDLEQGPCVIKRVSGCGAGSEYVAVTPTGEIYPCHRFAGEKDYKMGDVFEGVLREDLKRLFIDDNVYSKKDCQNCFAKFYCSGGCHANNILIEKDIDTPYKIGCEMEKKRVECAIAIKAKLAVDGDI